MNARQIFSMFLLATLVCISGCEWDAKQSVPYDGPWWPYDVGSIQIVMPWDTLRFLPGDSASSQGFVVVKDNVQNAMPGVKVSIGLTQPFGVIELVTNDTTNAAGRVYFWFRTYRDETGNNVIHASASGREANWPITVLPSVQVLGQISISLSATVLRSLTDSVIVRVITTDSGRVGIPGLHPSFYATGGRLVTYPTNDSTGYTRAIWYPDQYGLFWIFVRLGIIADSACVTVIDTTAHRHVATLDRRVL